MKRFMGLLLMIPFFLGAQDLQITQVDVSRLLSRGWWMSTSPTGAAKKIWPPRI